MIGWELEFLCETIEDVRHTSFFSRLKILGQGLVKLLWKLFYFTLNQFSYPFASPWRGSVKKRRKSSERSVRAKKKKNLKKFDPIRVEARDSISETRNSLMSVTVERLSAVFSTRSRFVAQRNARFACLPAGNLCYVIARIPRRNEVERDVLPDRVVREIKMVERLRLFFQKTSTLLDRKGKQHIRYASIYFHRCGHIAAWSKVRTRSPSALLSSPSPLEIHRFLSLVACWRKREICRGTMTSLMEKLDASSRGSTSLHDSLRLRLSPRFRWFEVNCVIHKSKIRLLFHGHNLIGLLGRMFLKTETRNRIKSTGQNIN